MPSLTELYKSIYEKLNSIASEYADAQSRLTSSIQEDTVAKNKRIKKLEELLEKIKEVSEKVEYFTSIAEQHITSRNLLTITPREVDFRRLRDWTTLIDATNNDDPHAQRVYVLSKCNQMYLSEKKAKFEEELRELTSAKEVSKAPLEEEVRAIQQRLSFECNRVLNSDEFDQLAAGLSSLHKRYSNISMISELLGVELPEEERIGLGVYALPFPVLPDVKYIAAEKLGSFYGTKTNSLLWPVELPDNKESVITVSCDPTKEKRMYRGLQNYLLNLIVRSSAGNRKIHILDALHYNNSSLGMLKPLENSMFVEPIPKDSEGIMDALKLTVASFTDMDEQLGMADSVEEYNRNAEPDKQICRRVMVLIGYPSAFPAEARQLVNRILLNREHYGVSVILANMKYSEKSGGNETRVEDEIVGGIVRIKTSAQYEQVSMNSGEYHNFGWYELKNELPASLAEKLRAMESKNKRLGTVYTNRVDMDEIPPYTRGKKSLCLPYGVDQMDQMHSISFDNENFASYLMGASGSGKSTLLHTIITGILRDYHPDDVELWLADFKMSEFAQYINPMPPHVKYILLDESPELVYDLLDKLTEKMMERQRFFMRHREMKKVENVPPNIYMPVIFVILDEFSIMSQAVAESEEYKLRLQNLLAKGRALGIKFIFASQTFTKGVVGLTGTAKDQIQSRIAMKNSYEEIDKTLELSSNTKTEQVRNWMDALPPHYALSKYRDGDSMKIKRLQVMYFAGNGDEALEPQRRLIKQIEDSMQPVSEADYDPDDVKKYVFKHPVVVDGNSYKVFDPELIGNAMREYRRLHAGDISDDDIIVSMGVPRRMAEYAFSVITAESRENILLIARAYEQACGMSVINSVIKCFESQNARVQIWAYSKNRLYRAYRNTLFADHLVIEGIDDICDEIRKLKEKISSKQFGNDLIVLLGMEQICGDFELESSVPQMRSTTAGADIKKASAAASVKTEEEQKALDDMIAFTAGLQKILDEIEDEGIEAGKSIEEIQEDIQKATNEYYARNADPSLKADKKEEDSSLPVSEDEVDEQEREEQEACGAYNASSDFGYIVRQGSRFGYHFMLCLNTLYDLKATRLPSDLFRHKCTFQLPLDDAMVLFNSRAASKLPEHICQYSDSLEKYSLRPYLHQGLMWDGWEVDENGQAINPNTI